MMASMTDMQESNPVCLIESSVNYLLSDFRCSVQFFLTLYIIHTDLTGMSLFFNAFILLVG